MVKVVKKKVEKKKNETKHKKNHIKIKKIDDFKIKNNAIYLFTMDNCRYCSAMKSEWNIFKSKNMNTIIYEINSNLMEESGPLINKKLGTPIVQYPTILKVSNNKIKKFSEDERSNENFTLFIK